MSNNLLWGCDASLQYESSWIRSIVPPSSLSPKDSSAPILVESGLIRLNKNSSQRALKVHDQIRLDRISKYLSLNIDRYTIIHLSDEEGNDGDTFYHYLPPYVSIFRNFNYTRFNDISSLTNFPIGPRDIFLDINPDTLSPSSTRYYPWSFMGTIWHSGSRFKACSYFLKHLPDGYYHASGGFGRGLPLCEYRDVMLDSVFVIAPEGDRHLDTFRLWESLCCGCIPLLVNYADQADFLLGAEYPIPVFTSWRDACDFAVCHRHNPAKLDELQSEIRLWWLNLLCSLRQSFTLSTIS